MESKASKDRTEELKTRVGYLALSSLGHKMIKHRDQTKKGKFGCKRELHKAHGHKQFC